MSFFITNPQFKPNYNFTFHNGERNIGRLDFNGDVMAFEGDVEESAKVFFDFLAKYFADRLKKERDKEREACASVCASVAETMSFDQSYYTYFEVADAAAWKCAAAIRARGES